MPCTMIDKSTAQRLANTLADLISARVSPSSVTGEALQACPLAPSLPTSPHEIARRLHALNAKAYQARHNIKVKPWPILPTFPSTEEESIYQNTSSARPAPWHYALCSMLDYWCTITDEPCTASDPLRLTLQGFAHELALSIVRHSAAYELYP